MGVPVLNAYQFSSRHRDCENYCASLTIIGHKKTTKKII